jgi:glycosyltransferase involved in cell wall biosynthesis
MKRILFVLPSLEYSGAARQATLLAKGLARDRFLLEVCVLGSIGPWREELTEAGAAVTSLGWKRWLDVRPLAGLRKRLRLFRPDVIHAYKPSALRAVAAAGVGLDHRVVVSSPWPPSSQRIQISLLDRALIHRVDKVLAGGPFEVQACRTLGLRADQIAEVVPGVMLDSPVMPALSIRGALGLLPNARLIACVGPLDPDKGFRNALWGFDILRYLFDNLHLVIIGVGGDQSRLQGFAHAANLAAKVHFLGPQPNVPSLLAQVDLVWVPSLGNTGINASLEGMAAARVVVASSRPMLADIIRHGESGILAPPNDPGALARETRLLLDDCERRTRLGTAARKSVQDHHDVFSLVNRCARLYESGET